MALNFLEGNYPALTLAAVSALVCAGPCPSNGTGNKAETTTEESGEAPAPMASPDTDAIVGQLNSSGTNHNILVSPVPSDASMEIRLAIADLSPCRDENNGPNADARMVVLRPRWPYEKDNALIVHGSVECGGTHSFTPGMSNHENPWLRVRGIDATRIRAAVDHWEK